MTRLNKMVWNGMEFMGDGGSGVIARTIQNQNRMSQNTKLEIMKVACWRS